MHKILYRGTFARIVGSPLTQPFWDKVLKLALFGMNYGGGNHIECSGEVWVLGRFLGRFPAGDTNPLRVIFDVGANNGDYASLIRSLVGDRVKLFCFEPSPTAFSVLQRTMDSSENLVLLDFGLSDKAGRATLYSDAKGSVVSSLHQGRTSVADLTEYSEECQLQSLDKFCNDFKINHIDLLKIDVEGNEVGVLRGAKGMLEAGAVDLIQFEFGEAQINSRTYFRDIFQILAPAYHIHRVLRAGLAPLRAYNEVHEVFRTTNYLAISKSRQDLFKLFNVKKLS